MKQGRIFQDDHFEFSEFNGLLLEKLVVCEDPDTYDIILVHIKVENQNWHRFFIDMGFGFWDNWGEQEIEYEETCNYVEYTEKFDLTSKIIDKIECKTIENNCQIVISFLDGENLILRAKDFKSSDSESELVMG